MNRSTMTYRLILGTLIGLLLIPPQPVQAQWTVYDPTNHATQIERMIQDAARWLETIDKYRQDIEHYAKMYDKAVEQLTTLKGVLKTVDEQLAKHKDLIYFVNDVGRIVRDSFRLYEQLERLVLHRIRALKNIDDRLRNGLFDIEQDKRDFETYLKYTMGRSARDTLSQRVRLAQMDTQLAFWLDEKQKLEKQIATYNELLKKAREELSRELNKSPQNQRNVQLLVETCIHYESMVSELTRQHAELTAKINDRTAQHGVRIQEMENFGRQVVAVNDAWRSLTRTRDKIAATLDKLVSGR